MPIFPYGRRETAHLAKRDPALGWVIKQIGHIEREIEPDLVAALMRSVIAQQISTKAAATVYRRLREMPDGATPEHIAQAPVEAIQACGMSMRKAGYVKGIARAALDGRLDARAIAQLDDAGVIAALSELKGVGVWTAEMLLILSLCRPNVLSWGDFAIRNGIMKLYGLDTLDKKTFAALHERYAPYASVASLYIWAYGARNRMPAWQGKPA
ncbi:MAG: DNA-3-methyladenine glycosylase 2 family protein [Deltaproteobacteria bacterium]|jgi:DNA-3-methyladenine glycosylase II|nr:DNA-3-methyladenine glycosylase 2 family protein [Deltaproteobacteria bacterium]